MAKKDYKNVYTILEKVKKGEIKTHYKKDSDGLFGKVNFYRRPDIIKPYLHYMDEDNVKGIVASSFTQDSNGAMNPYLQKEVDKYKNPNEKTEFLKKLTENYRKLPKHLIYDIYKMYYSKMDKLKFEDRSETNNGKYRLLERSNNPIGKIMSENAELKSSIFTQSAILNYLIQLTKLELKDPEAKEELDKCMNGESDKSQKEQDKLLDKFMNSTDSKKSLDEAMKHAEETCKMIDENIPEDIQKEMFENGDSDKSASKIGPQYLKEISDNLRAMKFSMRGLKERLQKVMNKATSYFSAKKINKYEDLFNADDVSGLEDHILLHPKLRKIFAEDIQVKDTKPVGKLSVYVDISGSMSGNSGSKIDGVHVSCLDFSKALIAKLKDMDMLEELYLFNNYIREHKTDIVSIARIPCDGGTDIEKVVRDIIVKDKNSVVITDAGDSCDLYSEKAFFIGVSGSNFRGFRQLQKYREGKQIIIFDGENVYDVNDKGLATKK